VAGHLGVSDNWVWDGAVGNCKVWKGGEIGSGLDLAEILVWLLDLRVATGLGLS